MSVLNGPAVFVDIETNGLSARNGKIIEIAAIRVENNEITDSFSSLVDPGSELPQFITSLTGITQDDLQGAPEFSDIAGRLYDVLQGAIFVAHNVRFDFSFVKEEFRRIGIDYSSQLLCSVRLSRSLFPSERGHKLGDIIRRCSFSVDARHRAYDDAEVVLRFIKYIEDMFEPDLVAQAIARQLKAPKLPAHLKRTIVEVLPEKSGVYIFEDEAGSALYIGKSLNIKKRVQSHFTDGSAKEMKIAHLIKNIDFIETDGELAALLLESRLIKERQPVYNTMLRRHQKMTILRKKYNSDGFIGVLSEDIALIDTDQISDILCVFTTKGKAKSFLIDICKNYGLCPKILGLEKGEGPCFSYQIKKCRGACKKMQSAAEHNSLLLAALEKVKLKEWPYSTPVLIQELGDSDSANYSMIIDQWCLIAEVKQDENCAPTVKYIDKVFDIDSYRIIRNFLETKRHRLHINPIEITQLQTLLLS